MEDKSQTDETPTADTRNPPRCGWCCWRPDFLQPCYKWQLGFAIMCWYSFLHGFILHGITPVNTSSLERRFKLSSVEIGWFNSVLELSAAISAILLSYLADRAHKPRWLMISAALFSVGCFVMSMPHYLAEPYDASSPPENLCGSGGLAANHSQEECSTFGRGVSWWLDVLVAGNAITGIGAGIIFTVGIAYVDDFSDAASSSLRMAIMFLCSAAGAAAGFAGGSALLAIDVNFNRPDWPQFTGNKDFSPRYVGAWWLGYVIGAVGFGSVAVLFSCFDYEMVETAEMRQKKTVETHNVNVTIADNVSHRPKVLQFILKFFAAFIKLCYNPVFVCITIAVVTHGLMTDGIQPFFVKILRTQYVISETKAGITIAILIVAAIGFGNLLSGILLKFGNFSLRTLLLIVLLFVVLAALFGFGLFIHCPQEKISGITVKYDDFSYYDPIPEFSTHNLKSTCNVHCDCSDELYQPICHPKLGVQFFSPCHGGCLRHQTENLEGETVNEYSDCSCLAPVFLEGHGVTNYLDQVRFERALAQRVKNSTGQLDPLATRRMMSAFLDFSRSNPVTNGVCDTSCLGFYGAMVLLFFILFCGYFTIVPLSSIVIRCVEEKDRAFAMAIYSSMERFLGAIPGPIMIGGIIDRVCIFREPTVCTGDEGSCFAYNVPDLARWLVGIFIGLHVVAVICYVFAFILYKPPTGETIRDYFKRKRDKSTGEEAHENSAYISAEVLQANL